MRPSFPDAQQAQIIRAHQRDLFHLFSLKESAENVIRSWLGTRWLSRWDKEVDLVTKLAYYGLTTGRGQQTLGEEYVDTWQQSSATRQPPGGRLRAALILLPSLSSYVLSKCSQSLGPRVRSLSTVFDVLTEVNLAIFYLRGTYYDIVKRVLGIKQISSTPLDPRSRPPSYSLLGVLILIRLAHRLKTAIHEWYPQEKGASTSTAGSESSTTLELWLDDTPVSTLLDVVDPDSVPAKPAEEDTKTMLDVASLNESVREGRHCTLCLEERTDSCATECGHLFCWPCIYGWGREKAECPLCRQSLNLSSLLPIYNL